LQARINKAAYELSFKNQFDKIILNDDLEKACEMATDAVHQFLMLK
jgi:guanylate kinase